MSQELSDLKILIAHMQDLAEQVSHAEATLSELRDDYLRFKDDIIPCFMRDLGLEDFTLETGENVSISTKYYGNISEARAQAALKWLRENQEGALIKTELKGTFGAGQLEQVELILMKQFLEEKDIEHSEKSAVHPQTLKSFIKRKMEAGESFPYELFGVYVAREIHVEK